MFLSRDPMAHRIVFIGRLLRYLRPEGTATIPCIGGQSVQNSRSYRSWTCIVVQSCRWRLGVAHQVAQSFEWSLAVAALWAIPVSTGSRRRQDRWPCRTSRRTCGYPSGGSRLGARAGSRTGGCFFLDEFSGRISQGACGSFADSSHRTCVDTGYHQRVSEARRQVATYS